MAFLKWKPMHAQIYHARTNMSMHENIVARRFPAWKKNISVHENVFMHENKIFASMIFMNENLRQHFFSYIKLFERVISKFDLQQRSLYI